MDAGNYRTSSTPDLVYVSFSPRLTCRRKSCPDGRFACQARGGAITTSPLRGFVGSRPAGSFVARKNPQIPLIYNRWINIIK